MGLLYYIAKLDGSREVFALNKVYVYDRGEVFKKLDGVRLSDVFPDEATLVTELSKTGSSVGWFGRVAQRLFKWAGDATIKFMHEGGVDQFHRDYDYDKHRMLITGSAHDSDYESDGVTYKPGSAW